MQLQTATRTTTAIMAFPSLPASPTLTNPDMILPYGDEYDSTPSPPQHPYRPPSSGNQWGGSNPADMQFSIGPPMAPITPTTPIIYGNGTMLSDIGEVTEAESTPGRRLPGPAERRMLKQAQNNMPIRSSPTMGYEAVMKRAKTGSHQRSVSIESSSTVKSEGQSAEIFKDFDEAFDDGISVDDSNFQGDDEESVADSYSQEVIAQETQRLSRKESVIGVEEDRNSSAALSRRAEQILLNAKKRLNNMEGNLTRARSNLYITPSGSLSSIHSSSPLSRSTPSPPENLRFISRRGAPPSIHRQVNISGSPVGSPGHSRVYSENSISPNMRTQFPERSSSAAARYIGKGVLDGNQRSPPFSKSNGNIRDEARNGSDSRLSSSSSRNSPPSKTSASHPSTLEPLGEDAVPDFEAAGASTRSSMDGYGSSSGEHRGLTRSASSMQMRDLRDQMHDLKGRLSVLRDRARDDTMKRRSMQSLRTPSPFTAAEQWYTTSKGYTEGGLSTDAGVAQLSPKMESGDTEDIDASVHPENFGHEAQIQEHEYPASDVTSVYEDVSEEHLTTDLQPLPQEPSFGEENEEESAEIEESQNGANEDDYNDEIVNREEADDYESDSSYHDAAAISHEDREDAFDYEHFFLHSAMGTMSQQRNGRRDSVGSFSSEDSVETTRGPVTQIKENRETLYNHMRSGSDASVSTLATFATATEGRRSEDLQDSDRENFAVQQVHTLEHRSTTPVTAKRETFGGASPMKNGYTIDRQRSPDEAESPSSVNHDKSERDGTNSHRPSIGSFDSFNSTGSARSFPLVNKPKPRETLTPPSGRDNAGSILSDSMTLIDRHSTGSGDRLQSSPVHMLARDDQILVERLVASLGKCVLGLQDSGRASYDGRVWRRRLDAARRVLEGDEGAV
ncbi:hypothetical protein LSUE1_G000305 [Lachnellula suecica]|uniref:Uncharacterized protein n=1 Tax=Lachnellula suecica TaxID=602035 RepID=A0A8T9CMG1_9HELO|nr:hypothetical protein LSUE1_G000305 [Lachnellula suecica]